MTGGRFTLKRCIQNYELQTAERQPRNRRWAIADSQSPMADGRFKMTIYSKGLFTR
jgi:hypothetical protein